MTSDFFDWIDTEKESVDIEKFLYLQGLNQEEVDFLKNLVNENFVNRFALMVKIEEVSEPEEKFLDWFRDFYMPKKETHTVYFGNKTNYLVEKEIFDEILLEIESLDSSDDDYRPENTPILVEKQNGTITFY